MFARIEAFRKKLDAGGPCLGASISFADPAVTEALGRSVDFLWIDLEHTALDLGSLQSHLIAARAAGVPALVRVPSSDVAWIKRVIDSGAEGLIVPQVSSAAEVRAVVSACRYAPLGNRGYGPRRPSDYGRSGGTDYLDQANRQLFVAAQIENMAAVRDLDAILEIPHLDSMVIGPYDLAMSMGKRGDVNDPEVLSAIQTMVRAARRAGRYVGMGMGAGDEAYARRAVEMGVQWLQVGGDYSYMIRFADALVARLRGGTS